MLSTGCKNRVYRVKGGTCLRGMIFVLLVTSSLKGWKKWRLVLKLAGVWLSGKVDNHGTGIYDTRKLMGPGREAKG